MQQRGTAAAISHGMTPTIPAFLTLAVASLPQSTSTAAGAPSGERVARFVVEGEPQTLSRDEVALFLVRRTRNSQTTRAALEHLIDVRLVAQAAREQGVMPKSEEVHDELRRIETGMKARKMSLDEHLKRQRMTREDMAETLSLGLAKTRLVARVLRKDPATFQATPEQLELWTRQRKNAVKIVTDPRQLPAGVVAQVGREEITARDLGRVLLFKITPENLHGAVIEMVLYRCLAAHARREGIEISRAELEKEFAQKKRAFELRVKRQATAVTQQVTYEQWLTANGGSKEQELLSTTTRALLQHRKLVDKRYPDAAIEEILGSPRGAALRRRHGARRSISVVLLRAAATPNKLVPRSFDKALAQARELRGRVMKDGRPFADVARAESDDPSKLQGGRVGWQHAEYRPGSRQQQLPKEVLAAAFRTDITVVSEPVRTEQGVWLVWVQGIEPEPKRETLFRRIRRELAGDLSNQLVVDAKVEMLVR